MVEGLLTELAEKHIQETNNGQAAIDDEIKLKITGNKEKSYVPSRACMRLKVVELDTNA
jgi:hypothetical protein